MRKLRDNFDIRELDGEKAHMLRVICTYIIYKNELGLCLLSLLVNTEGDIILYKSFKYSKSIKIILSFRGFREKSSYLLSYINPG